MRALPFVLVCCVGCSTGLPLTAPSLDAAADGSDGSASDLGGGDGGAPHDLAGDMTPGNDLAAPALHLVVQSTPASIGSGKSFNVSVQVLDAANQPVTISRPVFLALGIHPTGATLLGTTTVAANNGVATFSVALDHFGPYTLIVTTPDAPPAETPIVTVQGTKLAWLTQPATAVAHQPMTPAPRVGIVDMLGNLDTAATGQISLYATSPCSGFIVGNTYVTATAGVASFSSVYSDRACVGDHLEASASAPLDTQTIVSDAFDVVAGAPAMLTLQATLPHTLLARDMAFDLVSHVEDAGGNEVALTTTATLSVLPSTPIAGPTSAATNGSSTATFAGVSVGVAGQFTFAVNAPGLQPAYLTLTVTPWQWRSSNVAHLIVDPKHPDVVWVDGSSGIYDGSLARSTDGAVTFAGVGTQPNDALELAIDPSTPTTMYGSSGYDTWKSTDGGQTTSTLALTGGPYAVTVDPSSSSRLYAVSSSNVWKSVDGGSTWSPITPAIASSMTALTVDPTNGSVLYLSGSSVWRSSDGGATWSAAGGLPSPSSDGFSRVAVDPAQASHLVACDESGCYRSVDGGANFTQVLSSYLGYDPIAVAFDPAAPGTVYACGDNGLATSSNGGASFTLVEGYPSPVYFCVLAPSSPSTIYVITSDGTWATTNGGK